MLFMLPCRGRLRELLEMPVQARAQRTPLRAVGTRSREHDEIPRRQRRLLTERFAGEALELVAVHGAFRSSARDRQAEARGAAPGRPRENGKEAIAGTRRLGEHASELCRRMQSLVGGEPCRVGQQRRAKTNSVYGVRRARPFARRLARTFRPAAVAMRARKPCVRLRCKLLG